MYLVILLQVQVYTVPRRVHVSSNLVQVQVYTVPRRVHVSSNLVQVQVYTVPRRVHVSSILSIYLCHVHCSQWKPTRRLHAMNLFLTQSSELGKVAITY